MTIAYIALGSNLGERRQFLDRALHLLAQRPHVHVRRVSSYHETAPVGGPVGQGRYLNAAAELETTLSPQELLATLLDIEHQLGRVRLERFGPRTIDLDLLLHGETILETQPLTLPHPRLHERRFVLAPLVEVAPHLVHPELGRTMQELLAELPGQESEPQPRPGGNRELHHLRALVTGSTSGIGKAIALELGRAGARVIVHGRRSQTRAEAVAEEIRGLNTEAAVRMADLRDAEACQALAEAAWREWDGLDILVNNAGADTLTGEAALWSFEQKWHELLAVDVEATMRLSRTLGAHMKAAGTGSIVTMGWDQAETGMEGDSGELFATIKGAVMCFTRALAVSLAPQVRVNCVAPGWIKTAWGEKASQVWQERVMRETPLHRWGTPEDVAAAVRWLVNPASAFMTGQIVRVNGGAVR